MATATTDTSGAQPVNLIAARTQDAVKVYGRGATEVRALNGITVEFPQGEFGAIMGPSGSGKSTLMHCMAGLDNLTSGRAFIGDADLSTLDDQKLTLLRRDRVGFVFQAFNLVPTLTALENITLPLALAGRKGDPDWIETIVGTVGLADRMAHRPSELSGGQQQRVAIARALAASPRLLIADEPTGQLDAETGLSVMALLRGVVESEGVTVLVSTHDPVMMELADRIMRIHDGQVEP